MAAQASRIVVRLRSIGIVMRVVAGHAVKRTLAFCVASAPGQRRSLKADPVGIGSRQRHLVVMAVAFAAETETPLGGGFGRTHDCRVGELRGDGFLVDRAGAVAALAADSPISRLRAGIVEHGPRVRRVAEQALEQAIGAVEGFPQHVVSLAGNGAVSGGAGPTRLTAVAVMRHPEDARMAWFVVADQREIVVGRAERVLDHGAENVVAGRGLEVYPAFRAAEFVDHSGIIRIRDRPVGKRKLGEHSASRERRGVAAALVGAEGLAMARCASRLTDQRAGLCLQRVLRPIRAGILERGGRIRQVSLLQCGTAQKPRCLPIWAVVKNAAEQPVRLPRPSGPQ